MLHTLENHVRPLTALFEEALADGSIELAVHAMKDVPTRLPAGFGIVAILEREDPRDAWFSRDGAELMALPAGALVGTASLRRQCQVRHLRPDLEVVTLRGNVGTRLAKLERGEVAATILAVAGLKRLGKIDLATDLLAPEVMLPAVAQGAIGLEARLNDSRTCDWLKALDHPGSTRRVAAERACLEELDGSCRTPIAAFAEDLPDGGLRLRSLLALPDGSQLHRDDRRGPAPSLEAAVALGRAAGEDLRRAAGPDFFAALAAAAPG